MNRYRSTYLASGGVEPVCGRPAGHTGKHTSEYAWRRKLDAIERARRARPA